MMRGINEALRLTSNREKKTIHLHGNGMFAVCLGSLAVIRKSLFLQILNQISPKRSTKVVAWTVFYLLCSSSM
jgi:hypothetical protein